MCKLLKYKIFFGVFCIGAASFGYSEMPAVCNSEFKSKISPYIEELEKQGPSELIKKIKKSKSSNLINYHMSYGQNIRNTWFYGKESKTELMKLYNDAGIHHIDDMSQDLIEGIWVGNSQKRCKTLKKEHALTKEKLNRVKASGEEELKK